MTARVVEILGRAGRFLLPLATVLVAWEITVRICDIRPAQLPGPLAIAARFGELSSPEPIIWRHIGHSVWRLVLGWTLGAGLGVPTGLLMGKVRPIQRALGPIVSLLLSIPTIAWVPVFLITVGIGDRTVVAAIALGTFLPVCYHSAEGARRMDRRWLQAATLMGAGPLRRLFTVLIPGAAVDTITGLRLGMAYAWRALVGAEMLAAASWGLGFMVFAARRFYDVSTMFLGLALIAVGGLLLDRILLRTLERRTIVRWGMVEGP
jgi:ABC-type nitrate/sulfonate/bicarbonate transport system permease component